MAHSRMDDSKPLHSKTSIVAAGACVGTRVRHDLTAVRVKPGEVHGHTWAVCMCVHVGVRARTAWLSSRAAGTWGGGNAPAAPAPFSPEAPLAADALPGFPGADAGAPADLAVLGPAPLAAPAGVGPDGSVTSSILGARRLRMRWVATLSPLYFSRWGSLYLGDTVRLYCHHLHTRGGGY